MLKLHTKCRALPVVRVVPGPDHLTILAWLMRQKLGQAESIGKLEIGSFGASEILTGRSKCLVHRFRREFGGGGKPSIFCRRRLGRRGEAIGRPNGFNGISMLDDGSDDEANSGNGKDEGKGCRYQFDGYPDESERCSGSSRLALLFLRPTPFREQLGQKRTSSGHGTAPLRCRLSDTTRPSLRASSRRRTLVMSC
jgi:hypothetical protein